MTDPAKTNAFREMFGVEASTDIHERKFDGLCRLCARVGIIAELFEAYADEEVLTLLGQIEDKCC